MLSRDTYTRKNTKFLTPKKSPKLGFKRQNREVPHTNNRPKIQNKTFQKISPKKGLFKKWNRSHTRKRNSSVVDKMHT